MPPEPHVEEPPAARVDVQLLDPASKQDQFARFREQAADRYAAEWLILSEAVERHESFEVHQLQLSTGQLMVLEEIAFRDLQSRSIHTVAKLLRRHQVEMTLREEFGDPAVLQRAEADASAARDRERDTRAALADIDVGDATDEVPALAQQIGQLQEKLAQLTADREAAERWVNRVKSARAELRRRAPLWLQNEVKRELLATERVLPCFREFRKIDGELRMHQSFVRMYDNQRDFGHRVTKRDVRLVNYARLYFPEAVDEAPAPNRSAHCDLEAARKYLDTVLPGKMAELESRRSELLRECKQERRKVKAPLERFVQSGLVHD